MTEQVTASSPAVRLVDPGTLVLKDNVREASISKPFVASLKEHGVLEPIRAVEQEDGSLLVRTGHRRTLGAIEAGLTVVPVYVVTAEQDEAARIIEQITENEHRENMTNTERVAAVEQLGLLGVSAAQIAKRTATKRSTVDAALIIAANEPVAQVVATTPDMTLEQAAALAEFVDDEQAYAALLRAAERGDFAHELGRQRYAKKERQDRAEQIAARVSEGITILDEDPWNLSEKAARLSHLRDAEGKPLDPAEHATCPGRALYVDNYANRNKDEKDGPRFAEVECCTDWASHGHQERPGYGGTPAKTKAADLSDDERETARKERAKVIANNRDWAAAEPVRREWVKKFLTRKTAPKGSAAFITSSLLLMPDLLSHYGATKAWDELLPKNTQGRLKAGSTAAAATDQAATMTLLAHVVAGIESRWMDRAWRGTHEVATGYLRYLHANGYTLSQVEHLAAKLPKTRKAAPKATEAA